MIKILNGFGYDEDMELGKNMLIKILDREDFWIKALRTFYSHRLNE